VAKKKSKKMAEERKAVKQLLQPDPAPKDAPPSAPIVSGAGGRRQEHNTAQSKVQFKETRLKAGQIYSRSIESKCERGAADVLVVLCYVSGRWVDWGGGGRGQGGATGAGLLVYEH
jgi:hypothetical protein